MPCIWLGHIGEYRLRPSRLGANTTFPRRPAASRDQDGIGPQSLRTQTVFPNMSSPDAWYSSNTQGVHLEIYKVYLPRIEQQVGGTPCKWLLCMGEYVGGSSIEAHNQIDNNGGIPCIWRGHIGEYHLSPERLGANTILIPGGRRLQASKLNNNGYFISLNFKTH